jgi:hypothetical protein
MPTPPIPVGSPGTTTTFGSDFAGVDDLDPNLTFLQNSVTTPNAETLACAQALARRLSAPFGALANVTGDNNYGYDLRDLLSSGIAPSAAESAIEAECRKDERVDDCTTTITVSGDQNEEQWTVQILCTSNTGDVFELTLAVTSVTVQLLTVGP